MSTVGQAAISAYDPPEKDTPPKADAVMARVSLGTAAKSLVTVISFMMECYRGFGFPLLPTHIYYIVWMTGFQPVFFRSEII